MTFSSSLLLILDDEQAVCRALGRVLKSAFDDIVCVHTVTDAELVLDTRQVTHVLCDHLLGPGQPKGMDLATAWKARHPSIERLIILTGSPTIGETVPHGVDAVIPKTTDPEGLSRFLIGDASSLDYCDD